MKTITFYALLIFVSVISQNLSAQEEEYQRKIEVLENLKDDIIQQEKEELKKEVEKINKQMTKEDITSEQAKVLKEEAAKKHALNIENKVAIVDNKIALLERNEDDVIAILKDNDSEDDGVFKIDVNGERVLSFDSNDWKKELRYDRRTYVDPVITIGFNNAVIDGQSLEDSPYKLGGSRFLELGWAWRTRVFQNSNAVRFSYGVSFQFNGLKPKDNQYFVVNNGEIELQEFEFDLRKSKFRMDNLVFPIHFEFGPSKFSETEERIRYSIRNKFRFGIGGYGGFNIGSRQKLKYKNSEGRNVKDKLKGGYDTSSFVYGLSAYIGFDGIQLYAKYDLNPIFKDAAVEQRNVSLGVRFDLN